MRATQELTNPGRGIDAVGYRESRANVFRRTDRGETPDTCDECGTETDVDAPLHSPTCARYGAAAAATVQLPKPEGPVAEPDLVAAEEAPAASSRGDHDRSVRWALDRAHAGDDTLEICAHCGCEVDVETPAHRPGCAGAGQPRVTTGAVLAGTTRPSAADGRDALARMDDGLPQQPPARTGRSTVTAASVPANDRAAAPESGPGQTQADAAATGRPGRKAKWDRDTYVEAIREWARLHDGKPPTSTEWFKPSGGRWPAVSLARTLFGSWREAVIAAGFEPHGRGRKAGAAKPAAAVLEREPSVSEAHPLPAPPSPTAIGEVARDTPAAGAGTDTEPPSRSQTADPLSTLDLDALQASAAAIQGVARALQPLDRERRVAVWETVREIIDGALA